MKTYIDHKPGNKDEIAKKGEGVKITIHCPKCREPLADKFSAVSCKITFGSFILPMECLGCGRVMDVRFTVEDYDKENNEMAERAMEWVKYMEPPLGVFWHSSTDISQALGDGKSLDTVVGKICSENPEWQFTLDYSFGKWSALFFESAVGYIDHGSAEADTPAMAICLAAAKTTDHDKEG